MTTKAEEPVSTETRGTTQEVKPVLIVVEGELIIPTHEPRDAQIAWQGFQYLLQREFLRQQPALALLYDLDISLVEVRRGSHILKWKMVVKLKNRISSVISTPGAALIITTALSLPGAINESIDLWKKLTLPVEQQLQNDLPHVPPTVLIIQIRPPADVDVFNKPEGGGTFTL